MPTAVFIFLWEYLKHIAYSENICDINHLQSRFIALVAFINNHNANKYVERAEKALNTGRTCAVQQIVNTSKCTKHK